MTCNYCNESETYLPDNPQCPVEPPQDWPPGAPWPPRVNFDGTPLYPPPPGYEEYLHEARSR